MNQLVAHLVGDYILQDNRMFQKKVSDWGYAFWHGLLYVLPFLFFVKSAPALWVISISHMIIDRYRIGNWIILLKEGKTEYSEKMPESLRTWLPIIQDNILHIVINGLAIYYL